MKNFHLQAALFLGCAVGAVAQTTATGYSFKGNALGMALADFKSRNTTFQCYTYDETQQPGKYALAMANAEANESILDGNVQSEQGSLRFGTKESKEQAQQKLNSLIPEDNKAHDAVIALKQQGPPRPVTWAVSQITAAPYIACSSMLTAPVEIGSAKVDAAAYQFFDDKLVRIIVFFPADAFKEISEAFTAKYGPSRPTPPDDYQNGYGAHWVGANLSWDSGDQHIYVHEGSGNGPAQEGHNVTGRVIYSDFSLLPPEKKAPVNF